MSTSSQLEAISQPILEESTLEESTLEGAETPNEGAQTALPAPPPLRPLEISGARRRSLRSRAHHLRPTVQIGQAGITAGVIGATQAALEQHELIKVSINSESPTERKSGATELGRAVGAHVIQVIGRVIVLFREAEKKPRARLKASATPEKRRGTSPRKRGAK